MHRLFVGNIPNYVTPNALKEVFNNVRVDVINVKARQGGYAFVDVPNQNAADRAIEIFKTFDPFGGFLRVEPSMPRQLHIR
uniref:RRM domain-containing protein n=1 Tax=Romanomermis culicivorax TaxID=13658 RepID=A0A915ICU5_ROMCU